MRGLQVIGGKLLKGTWGHWCSLCSLLLYGPWYKQFYSITMVWHPTSRPKAAGPTSHGWTPPILWAKINLFALKVVEFLSLWQHAWENSLRGKEFMWVPFQRFLCILRWRCGLSLWQGRGITVGRYSVENCYLTASGNRGAQKRAARDHT